MSYREQPQDFSFVAQAGKQIGQAVGNYMELKASNEKADQAYRLLTEQAKDMYKQATGDTDEVKATTFVMKYFPKRASSENGTDAVQRWHQSDSNFKSALESLKTKSYFRDQSQQAEPQAPGATIPPSQAQPLPETVAAPTSQPMGPQQAPVVAVAGQRAPLARQEVTPEEDAIALKKEQENLFGMNPSDVTQPWGGYNNQPKQPQGTVGAEQPESAPSTMAASPVAAQMAQTQAPEQPPPAQPAISYANKLQEAIVKWPEGNFSDAVNMHLANLKDTEKKSADSVLNKAAIAAYKPGMTQEEYLMAAAPDGNVTEFMKEIAKPLMTENEKAVNATKAKAADSLAEYHAMQAKVSSQRASIAKAKAAGGVDGGMSEMNAATLQTKNYALIAQVRAKKDALSSNYGMSDETKAQHAQAYDELAQSLQEEINELEKYAPKSKVNPPQAAGQQGAPAVKRGGGF